MATGDVISQVPVAQRDSVAGLPPISGFWRRFAAFFLDTLLLGILGHALGWTLSPFWFRIGPYGRIVGLLVIPAYFGLMNSRVGNGQTLGKRLLKIAVRDEHNKPVAVRRSLLRIAILAAPGILNGWTLPVLQAAVLAWLDTVIVFGLGAAILYTMVFNRRARQGLHDLVCRTYVVHLPGQHIVAYPPTARMHRVISAVLVALAGVLATLAIYAGPFFVAGTPSVPAQRLYQALQADNAFRDVFVSDYFPRTGPGTVRLLQVQVRYKGKLSSGEQNEILNRIAKTVLDVVDDTSAYDGLRIAVTSSIDLGIASSSITFGDAQTFPVWRERLIAAGSAPKQPNQQ